MAAALLRTLRDSIGLMVNALETKVPLQQSDIRVVLPTTYRNRKPIPI